ncbi:glycosyltransferase family 29 protein [Helicobacter turcicus]|uniref:Glycosyltransferase family 29 protein n=1 Tax=Helicobacter turcicus TaxID=2867412 RepID=A0ABS7JQ93_9HELI|nr:glycosyltransferase family 29 protein [Helicobacter turcicus]MBX7491550.1 glycosyltransferase family 29 protein [Helicobacter turcicus]MBX7546401.1 glycosyltransferase family 29 protein [Helicobacter turcicus]
MDKIAVSVIVPCYNVKDYVSRCLKSLQNQKLKDIEILIINDGSTDDTAVEIKKFLEQNEDKRFLYLSQENGGYGSAVNLGIKHSKGKYIAVCEPDDYVDEDFYNTLYVVAEENNYEVVCYNGYLENREHYNHLCIQSYTPETLNGKISRADLQNRFLHTNTAITLCLYAKSFLKRNHITLPQTCKVYQDVPFVAKVFSTCDKLGLVIGAKYYYTRGRAEQSVANPARFIEIIPAIEDLLSFVESNENKLNIDKKYIYGYSLGHLLGRYKLAKDMDAKDTLRKISKFLNAFLLSKESITNAYIKNTLQNFGFNVDKIHIEVPRNHSINFWTLKGIRNFCINANYEELLSFFSYEVLQFQNLTFERKLLSKLESDLKYFMDIPKSYINSQVIEVLTKLLKNYDVNILTTHYPKLLAYISIILKDSLKSELTIPSIKLRDDAMEILEYYYNQTAITIPETPLIKLSKTLDSLMNENETQFLRYIENKRIIVVGNSPIELGKNKGKVIDGFDIVIRFNNFVTQGYEEDYGSKTSIWGISPSFETISQREIRHFDFIISNDSSQMLTRAQKAQILKISSLGIAFFRITTCEFLEQTHLRTLSMGLVMILFILKHKKRIKELSCAGFSLEEQKDGIKHYFKGDPSYGKRLPYHNWVKEKEIFNRLISNEELKLC